MSYTKVTKNECQLVCISICASFLIFTLQKREGSIRLIYIPTDGHVHYWFTQMKYHTLFQSYSHTTRSWFWISLPVHALKAAHTL